MVWLGKTSFRSPGRVTRSIVITAYKMEDSMYLRFNLWDYRCFFEQLITYKAIILQTLAKFLHGQLAININNTIQYIHTYHSQ
jgi:hypothetical protein